MVVGPSLSTHVLLQLLRWYRQAEHFDLRREESGKARRAIWARGEHSKFYGGGFIGLAREFVDVAKVEGLKQENIRMC